METILKAEGLTHLYAPKVGANSIDLELQGGEIVGFIGANGSGKSTTMFLLMNLLKRQKGALEIFETKIENRDDLVKLLPKIGFMPAEKGSYEHMNAKSFFKYLSSFYEESAYDYAIELASEISLDINKKISELSFGNKKKVTFIASIMNSPRLLILDEPTAGMDPVIRNLLFRQMEAVKNRGGAVLLSSHVLSEVQSICDRIYLIKDSEILLNKSTRELLRNAKKKVTHFDTSKALQEALSKLESVTNFHSVENGFEFLATNLEEIMNLVSKYKEFDFLVEETSLEEMFLDYYK